jgi:hypothetical protein
MKRAIKTITESTLPKKRKTRKPMSAEQKAASAERLAIARKKRLIENPPEYKSIHPEVLALGENHIWSMQNVRKWIKTQKELLTVERANVRADVKGSKANAASIEGYINNMESYLKNGVWTDLFWGEYQQNKAKSRCLVMAYYPNGKPKRSIGVWYADIGCEWTREMEQEGSYDEKGR